MAREKRWKHKMSVQDFVSMVLGRSTNSRGGEEEMGASGEKKKRGGMVVGAGKEREAGRIIAWNHRW